MQEAKEEVRSRLNIEDVIGEYVQLKRAGRNFKGLSPFTGEKTPSFFVSPEKHIWHDFSSNKGGDIFSFIMEVEGLDFMGSLQLLARKAGVDLSMYDSKGSQEIAKLKKRLLEANRLAAAYYQQSLLKNKHALDYVFKKRGMNKEIVQSFQIGYATTSGNALTQFLSKKGFTSKELEKAGLVNRFGGDLFRGRMMVPLMDTTGQVIGFTARVIDDSDSSAPKYLNTPQTLLYDKSRHVFALSQAKESIRKNDYAVIVEGNMDAVSSHQAGVDQVVATAGTAMTEHHLRALVRLTSHVRLAFDGDKAGLAATERAIPIAQAVGVDLSIITLAGDAKDPDDLIQKDVSLWRSSIESSEPAVDWVIKQHAEREDLTSAQGKRRFTTAALEVVKSLKDPVEQEHYLAIVAEKVDTSIEALKMKFTGGEAVPEARQRKVLANSSNEVDEFMYQDNILSVMAVDPSTRRLLTDEVIDMFNTQERQHVAKYLMKSDKVLDDIPKQLQKYDTYVKILILKADTRYAEWSEKDRLHESARLVRQMTTDKQKQHKQMLTDQLRDAEMEGDDEKASEIRASLNTLIKEIKNG